MTMRLNPRWLLLPALLVLLPICRAQAQVPPSISFDLGSSNAPDTALWDLSGGYSLNLTVNERNGTPVPVQFSFTLVQAPNGTLSSPSNDIQGLVINGNSIFAVVSRISGKVTGSGGSARAHMSIRFSGTGNLGSLNGVGVNGSLSIDAETTPGSTELVGNTSSKFSVKFSNSGSIRGTADFDTSLPSGVDGTWNLTLNLVPSTPLRGTGIATVNSDAWGLDLSGKNRGGLFKVIAKGAGNVANTLNATGSSATMLLSDPFDTLQFNGKFLGQKLGFFFTQD